MYPRLADAIGLKHMFDGFGSRKKVEPDDKEVQNMRRRQSFIDSTADNDEEEDDDGITRALVGIILFPIWLVWFGCILGRYRGTELNTLLN